MTNYSSRVERLEQASAARDARARFRVIVPPKMSREEWERRARTPGGFTLKLDNAGVFEGEDDEPSVEG